MNMDIWVTGTLNQLFKRGSYIQINFSKKMKQLAGKLRSSWWVHFVHPIQFVLTWAFEREVLHRNVALSLKIRSTKKQYSNFFKKKVFVFQITYFKVKVFETLKISSDSLITSCRSLTRRMRKPLRGRVFQC